MDRRTRSIQHHRPHISAFLPNPTREQDAPNVRQSLYFFNYLKTIS